MDVDRIQHGYDRADNRLWREDSVAGTGHDELYEYDDPHRLIDAQPGDLNQNRDDWMQEGTEVIDFDIAYPRVI